MRYSVPWREGPLKEVPLYMSNQECIRERVYTTVHVKTAIIYNSNTLNMSLWFECFIKGGARGGGTRVVARSVEHVYVYALAYLKFL